MIIPTILELDFDEIKTKVDKLDGVSSIIQIDVCDGKLVNGKTFLDIHKLDDLITTAKLEIHLLVEDPSKYVNERVFNCDNIVAQVEGANIDDFILKSKQIGYKKIGLCINMDTPNFILEDKIDLIDYVQFMAVEPGAQGRPFDIKVIEKIKKFRQTYPDIEIQVDGHMTRETILLLKDLNINNYIVGSAIVNSDDPVTAKAELESLLNSEKENS